MNDLCAIKKCKRPLALTYSAGKQKRNRYICDKHWNRYCEEKIDLKDEGIYKINR